MDKDISDLKPKLEALKSTVNEITTELYRNAAASTGSQTEGNQQEQSTGGQSANEPNSESSTSDETKNS